MPQRLWCPRMEIRLRFSKESSGGKCVSIFYLCLAGLISPLWAFGFHFRTYIKESWQEIRWWINSGGFTSVTDGSFYERKPRQEFSREYTKTIAYWETLTCFLLRPGRILFSLFLWLYFTFYFPIMMKLGWWNAYTCKCVWKHQGLMKHPKLLA